MYTPTIAVIAVTTLGIIRTSSSQIGGSGAATVLLPGGDPPALSFSTIDGALSSGWRCPKTILRRARAWAGVADGTAGGPRISGRFCDQSQAPALRPRAWYRLVEVHRVEDGRVEAGQRLFSDDQYFRPLA